MRAAPEPERPEAPFFATVRADWLKAQEREAAAKTARKLAWLCEQLAPLDARPIDMIAARDVYELLKPYEAFGKMETAARLRSTASRIFRYAGQRGLVTADPTALLAGAFVKPKAKPRAALTSREGFARLIRAMAGYRLGESSIVRDGLFLLALTACRPGEIRLALWGEIDLDRAEWAIPAGRMKARQPHRTPLSTAAVALLRRLEGENGTIRPRSPYVLPSPRLGRPLSDAAFNVALRAMGFAQDEASAHGFRASFSTLANESGLWAYDAIERQLAHQDGSEVRRAYHRADYFEERRRLMEWWAREIEGMAAGAG